MQSQFPQLSQLCLAYFFVWAAEDKVINMVEHVLGPDQGQLLRKLRIDRQVLYQVVKVKERHSTILFIELSQPQNTAPKLKNSVLYPCISLQFMQLILYRVVIGICFYLLREIRLD